MKPTRAVFGFHAVLARLRADAASVTEIYLDEDRKDARARDLVLAAEKAGVSLMRVPTKRLDGFYGGGRHQGVVAMAFEKPARESLDDLLDSVKEAPLLLVRSEEHTSELQSPCNLVCRLLLEKKKTK